MASPARAELFARAERARATAILGDIEGRAVVTITVPHDRLARAEHFVVIQGGTLSMCAPVSDVEEVTAAKDTSVARAGRVIDLCGVGAPTESVLHVRLRSDLVVELRCPAAPRRVRGIVLPATSAPDLKAAIFDFAVVSSAGVFGVLEPRALALLDAVSAAAA